MAIVTVDTPAGYELPTLYKQLTLEMFGAGSGTKTIHNDEAAAKREGLPGPIAVGPQLAANIFKIMTLCFGDGWICGGKADIAFRRPIASTDFISAKGIVVEKIQESGRTRVVCNVWIENGKGEKAVTGTCSALLPAGA